MNCKPIENILIPVVQIRRVRGLIYPLKTGIYVLVGIPERTFTRKKL